MMYLNPQSLYIIGGDKRLKESLLEQLSLAQHTQKCYVHAHHQWMSYAIPKHLRVLADPPHHPPTCTMQQKSQTRINDDWKAVGKL